MVLYPAGRLFAFIVRDFANPPVIGLIDTSEYHRLAGDPIRMEITDETEVTGVTVRLEKQDGTLIEEGAATDTGADWRYVATVAAPADEPLVLQIAARDRAHITNKSHEFTP